MAISGVSFMLSSTALAIYSSSAVMPPADGFAYTPADWFMLAYSAAYNCGS